MRNRKHFLQRVSLALLLFCLAGTSAWAGGTQTRVTLYQRGEGVCVAYSVADPLAQMEGLRGGETAGGEIVVTNQCRRGVYALYWKGGNVLPANIELTVRAEGRVIYRGPACGEKINLPFGNEDALAQAGRGVFLGIYPKGEGALLCWEAVASEELPMGLQENRNPPESSAGAEFFLVEW